MNPKGYYAIPVDYKPLSAEEERKLFLRVQKGGRWGKEAEQKVLGSYLLLAAREGRRAAAGNKELDDVDVISAANDALLRAVRNFDPDRGVCFATYSLRFIRGAVSKLRAQTQKARFIQAPIDYPDGQKTPEELRDSPHLATEEQERLDVFTRILNNSEDLLEPQEKKILRLMRQHRMNMSTVSRILRCSRERVRQIYETVLVKLRREFKALGVESL